MVELAALLENLRGKKVYFEPLGGNHGDWLIVLGSLHVLAKYDVKLVRDPHAADMIVLNGGGGLGVELWDKDLEWLRGYAQTYAGQPLVILPSSFDFQGDRLARCFDGRAAPAYVFARERYSFEKLAQPYQSEVQTGLADDMALGLRDAPYLDELKKHDAVRHVLIVERSDLETVAAAAPGARAGGGDWKQRVPRPLRRAAKKLLYGGKVASSPRGQTALERLYSEQPQYRALPVVAQDISLKELYSFEHFERAIVEAAVVITTRLHVGILAALLDKPTYMLRGSTVYPKIQGVYEFSLREYENVKLW